MELTIDQALQQGIAAHRDGRLQDAERFYRSILQAQPTHPHANHNLGLLAVAVEKTEVALPLFKAALEANPKVEQFWLSYIEALIKDNQFDSAKQVLLDGAKAGLAREKVDTLTSQLGAASKVEVSTGAIPPQQDLDQLMAHYQGGRFVEAENLARSITERYPGHSFAWKVLGIILSQTGRLSEALGVNQHLVHLDPQDAEAHNNFGNTLKKLGRLKEAEASFNQAIALKPDYAETHSNLGNTLEELGRLDEALASFNQAIALKPNFAQGHSSLGNTLKKLGRLDEAVASYNQAIALKPDYAEAHSNLGITLQELGRLDKALASYNRAITLKPDLADALYNRSLILFDKAEYEAALRDACACVSKKAIVLTLTSLYALGRMDEIYKRIEFQSKVDGEDIRISAFAAFISELEKKPTAYNFCPNPIDFIHIANLSSHVNDSATYIGDVIEELNKIETIWEPSGKSTVSGFQSLTRMNLFANSTEKIAQLKSIIINEIEAYYSKFQNEKCSYIQKFPTKYNLWGWTVILKHQGHQTVHIHASGWLSGVIY